MRVNRFLTNRTGVLDVEKDRRSLEEMAKLFKPLTPVECKPVIVNNIPAEWIAPPGLSTQRVILYLHGGSFNAGSVASHRSLAANLATACNVRVLIIDYRLAPDSPCLDTGRDTGAIDPGIELVLIRCASAR